MKPKADTGYNGPSKEEFLETLADYESHRFDIMSAMSKAGKVVATWEKSGGDKADLKDGYALRKLEPEDQKAELRRQFRVASWLGIVDSDRIGQRSFINLFDVKEEMFGIGGAPLGSRLSIIRAKSAGFGDGKSKNGPGLQEGLEAYGWPADCDESMSYSEGFGEGLGLRPPPKARKGDAEDDQGEDEGEAPGEAEPPKSALGVMVGQLQEMDKAAAAAKSVRGGGKRDAGPASDTEPQQASGGSVQSIWDNGLDDPDVPRMVN